MWSTLFGGVSSSRPASAKKHSHRSSSNSTRRVEEDAETEDDAPVQEPDAHEIRKRRVDYYEHTSPLERRRMSEAAAKARTKTSSSLKATSITSSEKRHTRRKHGNSSTAPSRRSKVSRPVSEGGHRTADYVYGRRPTVLAPIDEERIIDDNLLRTESRPSRHRRHSKSSIAASRLDDEVHPNDSISQVGSRTQPDKKWHSTRTRPALKRSSTTSTRLLERVFEEPSRRVSTSSSRRSSRLGPTSSPPRRRHSTTSIPPPPPPVECLTCGTEDVPYKDAAHLACSHHMCNDCLRRVFELSIKDPVHMPPKCCTDDYIPLHYVGGLFDDKFKATWNRKFNEYNTKNRLYCPKAGCGHWIKPKHIHSERGKKFATCPKCKTKICALCKNKKHKSSDCPKDPEIARIVEQGKKEGWKRCYSCKSMVERSAGCNHMTCRCTAEFCIVCGLKWKTCSCSWFEHGNQPNAADLLRDLGLPDPIRAMHRDAAFADLVGHPPFARAAAGRGNRQRPAPVAPAVPAVTYQQEMEARRLQEQQDAELAERLQWASLLEPDDQPRRRRDDDLRGLGNVARHFLNDDFVQTAANVVMNAFGDPDLGRRGERASGRRRRARAGDQNEGEPGLPGDFLGDASVLGAGPAR